MKAKILFVITSLLFVSGCTRSIATQYEEGLELESNTFAGKSIAVQMFEDQRAWIDGKDAKSQSFIAQQGPWRFGVDYAGTEYFPVNAMLQDIFVRELKAAGADAKAESESNTSDYLLSGKIMNFEFENETGFVTVTSRRHVSLAVTLVDKQGNAIFANELFNELDREGEGMGVLHSTNVNKLMGGALKKVLSSVLNKVNSELAYQGVDEVRLMLNGQDVTDKLHTQYVRL